MNFWLGPFSRLLLLALVSLLAGGLFGTVWAVALLAAGFALADLYHLWQLGRLRRWLKLSSGLAGPPLPPDALGAWGSVFAALFRMQRAGHEGQARLQDALNRLRLAAEALPEGVVLLDGEGRIEWANPQSARDLGLDRQRDKGTPIAHLLREPAFARYLERGGDSITLRHGGDEGKVLALALVPFAEGGRLLVSQDVSAVERADRMRRDFVANVSHELRTPLTVIVGFLETLMDQTGGQDSNLGALSLMAEQAGRMQHLVDDLLTLSRLDENRSPDHEDVVAVDQLLADLAAEARALSAGAHPIEFHALATAGVRGDPEELRSAFANLVSNAVRYTPPGGRIELRWSEQGGQPAFEVEDEGVGIAAEHIPRLTERFYRVDRGRSSATGGTGLGLAIVKHVLLRHGARLEIESRPGQGSTFRAVFPAERRVP